MSTIALPITEARKKFLNLVKEVKKSFGRFIITRKGKPEAIVISYDEYEGWLETLDIASDSIWVKDLIEAKKEFKKGKFIPFKQMVGRLHNGSK